VTFSTFAGICLTLALVLGLLAVTLRVLRKVSRGGALGRSRGAIPLEVMQRISLGPRQGIAVVRIADQLLAVSIGEGGVRTLLELDDVAQPSQSTEVQTISAAPVTRDFRSALVSGMRSAGVPFFALAAMTLATVASAHAQVTPTQVQGTAPKPADPLAPRPVQAGSATARQSPPGGRVATPAQVARPSNPAVIVPQGVTGVSLDQTLGNAIPKLELSVNDAGKDGGLRLSGTVGVVIMLGLLTLLPTLVLMMTGFTRILIVLQFLKQALGTQAAPPNQLIGALALLLTGFVMAPTMKEVNRVAVTPWLNGQIEQGAMMTNALVPMRAFMLRQVRERDVAAFIEMSGSEAPERIEDVSTVILTSAFVTSELRTAFQLGFVLFLPFIIIDIVVASVLMSMGMMMLPPAMISLPFKLLLFVLVDGWSLLTQSLVQSFR
jgi:flagellar biosynthesis protein FliP